VAAVLITFERPASMSRSEVSGWISERAQPRSTAITLGVADSAEKDLEVVRVEVRGNWTEAAQDQLADLMMDMRLLGLRPEIVSTPTRIVQ
jgi:hypothetical protein